MRRWSPYSSRIAINSSRITSIKRSTFSRILMNSAIFSSTSPYSSRILSCSRPVNLCNFKSRIACACFSDKRYALPCKPSSGSRPIGLHDTSPARAIMSATTPASQVFASNCSLASAGLAEFLINSIISSILLNAIAKPSKICARARALRKL